MKFHEAGTQKSFANPSPLPVLLQYEGLINTENFLSNKSLVINLWLSKKLEDTRV